MHPSSARLLSFYLKLFFSHLVACCLFRGLIYLVFRGLQGGLDGGDVLRAFKVGFFFDLRFAAVISLAFSLVLLLFIGLSRRWPSALYRRVLGWLAVVWGFFVVAILSADVANFSYLNEHLNGSAIRYLDNPWTSFNMIIETYPVWILGPLALLAVYLGYRFVILPLLVAPALPADAEAEARLPWKAFLLLFLFSAPLIYGKVSAYPLRWSDAFFSSSTFVSQLGLNPFLYFFDTVKNRKIDYDLEVSRSYDAVMAGHLETGDASRESLQFGRPEGVVPISGKFPEISPNGEAGIKNVVVIVVESLGTFKIGALGHPLSPSPNIDRLISRSYTFSNHYSSVAGTARGLFTLVTGLPDVARVETSSRNPLVINQDVLLDKFPQPDKSFWIGGSAAWGNIRALYGENISGIDIVEEGHFEAERNDVWGVSDLDLFKALHESLEAKTEPFFAMVMTAGYHRPYTIPEGRGDFELADVRSADVKRSGFSGKKEFDSFRFADYTLGAFFEMAEKSSYFDETLFVITGDHGLTNRGAEQLSEAEKVLNLERCHIPLILYAPALIEGGRIDVRNSHHMDVVPTIAHLLGIPGVNRTLGRSLFCPEREGKDGTFLLLNPSSPYHIGWLEEGWFLSYKETGVSKLYAYPSDGADSVDASSGELAVRKERMEGLARGHYEVTRYLLYHNRKDEGGL